ACEGRALSLWVATRFRGRIEGVDAHRRRAIGQRSPLEEGHADLFQNSDRRRVVRIGDGEKPAQPERAEGMVAHGARRLERIALSPMLGQKGEADVRPGERVAPNNPGDAEWSADAVP